MFFSLSLQAKGAIGTCIDPNAMLTLCIGDMVSLPTKFLREAFVRPKYRGRLCESLIPFLVYRRICNFIKLKCDNDSFRITNPFGRQSSHAFCSPYHPGILIHLFCPPNSLPKVEVDPDLPMFDPFPGQAVARRSYVALDLIFPWTVQWNHG